MYRLALLIILIVSSSLAYGKTGNIAPGKQAARLAKALLERDSVALNTLLHKDLTYGHSNGWIESKQDVINDLFNGTLVYQQIIPEATPTVHIYDKTGIVRETISVTVVVAGKAMTLKLKVLQTWIKVGNEWRLLARQSVKVD